MKNVRHHFSLRKAIENDRRVKFVIFIGRELGFVGDKEGGETLGLVNERELGVFEKTKFICKSPKPYRVHLQKLGDINNDIMD